MKLALATVIGATGLLAACADYPPPPPPPPPAALAAAAAPPPVVAPPDGCFRTRDITNHTIGDDGTLYLNVNNRDVYRLEMSGSCLAGAASNDPLVMREPPGSPYACQPIDLDISISKGSLTTGMPTPCIVRSMTRMTPAEVASLPPRLRP